MKKFGFIYFFLLSCLSVHSQKKDKDKPIIITCPMIPPTTRVIDENTIFTFSEVDIKPQYPGGMELFFESLKTKYKTPNDFLDSETNRRIFVGFTIEKDGSLTDIKIYREPKPEVGNELIKILKSLSKWKPGLIKDESVRVSYTFPFKIPYKNANKK